MARPAGALRWRLDRSPVSGRSRASVGRSRRPRPADHDSNHGRVARRWSGDDTTEKDRHGCRAGRRRGGGRRIRQLGPAGSRAVSSRCARSRPASRPGPCRHASGKQRHLSGLVGRAHRGEVRELLPVAAVVLRPGRLGGRGMLVHGHPGPAAGQQPRADGGRGSRHGCGAVAEPRRTQARFLVQLWPASNAGRVRPTARLCAASGRRPVADPGRRAAGRRHDRLGDTGRDRECVRV